MDNPVREERLSRKGDNLFLVKYLLYFNARQCAACLSRNLNVKIDVFERAN